MILRTLLLTFFLCFVRSNDIDDLLHSILNGENNTNIINPRTKQLGNETCTCVPYYLCPNGSINTDSTGVLEIKAGNVCDSYIDVCCKEPSTTPTMPPPRERKGCGQRHPEGVGFKMTAYNNSKAQFGEFPWMVALLKERRLDENPLVLIYRCGGVLIHERVVLTAAHCLTNNKNEKLIVRAGEWNTQTTDEIFPHQSRNVNQTIIHPEFKIENLWNDFALLVVDKPFKFADNVDTVCLPSPGIVPLSKECYASGWGKNEHGFKGKYQEILKKIDLPLVAKDTCTTLLRRTRLSQYFRLHDSFLCAGGIIGKDTCEGDGGSPLVCPVEGKPGTYEVTGIVSWGIGCGSETPGVYASVAYARPWIDKTMKELGYHLQ